jgi:polysaccharide export outer membrane protein
VTNLNQQLGPSPIRIVKIDSAVASRQLSSERHQLFSESLAASGAPALAPYVAGPGDVLEISVWEAPPATLFGGAMLDSRGGIATSRVTTLPAQMIAADGTVNVPFAGSIPVTARTPEQIEADIAGLLQGKANQPQVLVRVISNNTSTVTVVGEVGQSLRMPLTPKGERLLDAIATAGGVRQPVGKITIQITRGTQVYEMPLEKVIESPKENVPLAPGDVVTALFQSKSFTVLGAAGKDQEVNFEAEGISLGQALARAGGVQDALADARGVFVFRFENPDAMTDEQRNGPKDSQGRVPVIYQLDLKNPASFLVAQSFPMRDRDVIYVSNAPAAELQKFLNILTSSIYSVYTLLHP